MSSTTTNFGLHKIDLTDAPPDITVLNQNWDTIDEELGNIGDAVEEALGDITPDKIGAVKKDGDVMTGSLTVIDNFNVNKTMDGVEYKTYIRPINYSIASNGDYSTGLLHYKDATSHAQLMFNKDGVILRDNVNGKAYQIFGQHNADLIKSFCLPLTGGKLSGNLDFEKVDNGSATIYKNHSDTADYGLIIRDVKADGGYNQLYLCAAEDTLKYRDTSGKTSHIFGQHNTELIAPVIQSFLTGGEISMVKSVQSGVILISDGKLTATATINAVDPSKAIVIHDGYEYVYATSSTASTRTIASATARLGLTNSTTITATRGFSTQPLTIAYQVVEYY